MHTDARRRVRQVFAFSVMGSLLAAGLSMPRFAGADETRNDALQAGESRYAAKDYSGAAQRLAEARKADPQSSEAALFETLADLRLDQPAKAEKAMAAVVRTTSDPALADDVARKRTIVLREANERAARAAVANEKSFSAQSADPHTVAVAPFHNVGTSEYAPLGKALAAMLIDNLSGIPGIRVLERDQVQTMIEEASLADSGLVEKSTAVRAGKLLRAGRITAGSHTDWTASPPHLRIDSLLVDVDQGAELATASAEGFATEFYQLVPKIATTLAPKVVSAPGAAPPDRARLQQEHTHSLPAALAFGRVLEAEDRKDADGARRACKEAEKQDPNFRLAKRYCGMVPLAWTGLEEVAVSLEAAAYGLARPAAPLVSSGTTPLLVGGAAAVIVGGTVGGLAAAGEFDGNGKNPSPNR